MSFKTGTVINGTSGDTSPSIYTLLQNLQSVNNNYTQNDSDDTKKRRSIKLSQKSQRVLDETETYTH